ncbi:MAG: ATP-dependent Clp protease adaptor ClpS [Bacteroidota bacterium]
MGKKEKYIESPGLDEALDTILGDSNSLILYNDDVHTFDYVIDALIEVCEHDLMQAEQCTYLVHYKGKCEVKNGTKEILTPMRRQLVEKGLKATIN